MLKKIDLKRATEMIANEEIDRLFVERRRISGTTTIRHFEQVQIIELREAKRMSFFEEVEDNE